MRNAGIEHIRNRIDFELGLSKLDLATVSDTLSSVTAHSSYWNSLRFYRFLVVVLLKAKVPDTNISVLDNLDSWDADDDDYATDDGESNSYTGGP